jgi:hypothetical protein
MTKKKTVPELKALLTKILQSPQIMLKAYGLGLNTKALQKLGNELIPFVSRFILGTDKRVVEVMDIEDNYWNPVYGLKGKIDIVVTHKTRDGKLAVSYPNNYPISVYLNTLI